MPLIDILRDGGAVVRQDGSLMRASTGCATLREGGAELRRPSHCRGKLTGATFAPRGLHSQCRHLLPAMAGG